MADDTATVDTNEADDAENGAEVDEVNEGLLATLTDSLGDELVASHITNKTLWVRVTRGSWVHAAEVARDRLGCKFFDFLSAIDWMPSPWGRYEDAVVDAGLVVPDPASAELAWGHAGGDTRFQVFARLADVRRQRAVILKVDVDDEEMAVPSITPVYAGANWHEREAWEMYGITFPGHPSLRHLYLPGGFEGHPLRKDFPLLARLVKPWPGIVDVEPMPEVAEPEADGADAGGQPDGEGGDS